MSAKSTFFKHTLYVIIANALSLGIAFFTRPLIARFLGPDSYGAFALIFATSTVIPAFVLLGFGDAVLYRVAKDPKNTGKYVGSTLAMMVALSVLLFVPLYMALEFMLQSMGLVAFAVAYVLAFATAFFTVVQSAQQGLERFLRHSISRVGSTLLAGVGAVAVALFMAQAGPTALARAGFVLVVAVASLLALGIKKFSFDKNAFMKLWGYAAPLALAGFVISLISVVDRYVLAHFYSNAQVGYYDAASSFAAAILPFSVATLLTMMPKVIKDASNTDAYFRRISTLNVLFMSVFGLGLFYFADLIIFYLLGESYVRGALLPMRILAVGVPVMSFYYVNGSVFASLAKMKVVAWTSVFLVVASLALNLLLVPSLASEGAAYASLLAYSVIAIAGSLWLKKNANVSFGPSLRQLGFFALFCIFYVAFVNQMHFAFKTLFFLIFCAASLLMNRSLVKEIFDEGRKYVVSLRPSGLAHRVEP
ncbi:flippase [Candidatus Micrarchaeota archaeon]|nr:flippase [Candidatus Micrarchaeota archaeon]